MISGKSSDTWKPSSTSLNYSWDKEEIKREIKKYCELNENENATYENLWDAIKSLITRKFIALIEGGKGIQFGKKTQNYLYS